MARFLRRFWREVTSHVSRGPVATSPQPSALSPQQRNLRRQVHETIEKVSDDIGRRYAFNTAIAALMELLNAVGKFDDASDLGLAVRHEALETMVLLLNPVTPHICHALWQALGHAIGPGPLDDQPWPKADPSALVKDSVTLAVQVNGKLRGTIEVAVSAPRDEIERIALAEPKVAEFVGGATPKKVIVVPGKIVNIVV
jgi:leucyl-tRNA synthetase